jgi:uncharacterized lipoprotein YajG
MKYLLLAVMLFLAGCTTDQPKSKCYPKMVQISHGNSPMFVRMFVSRDDLRWYFDEDVCEGAE